MQIMHRYIYSIYITYFINKAILMTVLKTFFKIMQSTNCIVITTYVTNLHPYQLINLIF